jgi:hypothetical protein
MSHAAHFANIFPKPWRLKRLLSALKRLLGAAEAAVLKALVWVQKGRIIINYSLKYI